MRRFEGELIAHLRAMPSQALKAIKESGKLEDDTAAKLKEEIASFKKSHWKSAAAPAKEKEGAAGGGKAEAPKAPEAPPKPAEKKAAH